VTESLSDREMKSLFARADCYVSPHRAEGLGLTLLEAMIAGKPVIATGHSGESDFVREDTALLLDYDLIEVGQGAEPYMAGAVWADPREDSLRRRMRQVLEDPDAARAVGARGRERAIELFSRDTTSARLKDEIARIWAIGGGLID
jgi:glycosyltransferase involved in cell wall biosynthesis